MSNINDYLLWRGDIPINEYSPLNEIDSMILARFSYLIFDKIDLKEEETIESISLKMKDFENDEFRYNGDKQLITSLGISNRFKKMIVTDFVQTKDMSVEKQFGAITVHISDKEMYVSFIGTDSSIVGWKEDCNMAFMKNVPAQLEGLNYLNMVADKYPRKKIRIGGHSKGGNIAIYSSISTSSKVKDRIIKVYNYDGPGLDKSIIESFKDDGILEKIITYIPQDSVIGRLLWHEEKIKIAESIEKGIYQHDIYSWQVLGTDMVYVKHVTNSSELINKTVNEWLKHTSPKQRQIFIDCLFEVFFSTSADTFGEISSNIMKNAPTLFKTYKGISEEDRKIMNKMLKEFAKSYAVTLKENEPWKTEKIKVKK